MKKIELISFDICPFVQRSVITLLKKNIPFDMTYIDLRDKPDWFLKISPRGKVPCLKVGSDIIFESAVINEYLDEITDHSLTPTDPLAKAKMRAWIEYGSDLIEKWFMMAMSSDRMNFEVLKGELKSGLSALEDLLPGGLFFNGENFTLADSSYIPLLERIIYLDEGHSTQILKSFPKISQWALGHHAKTYVTASLPENFPQKMDQILLEAGAYLAKKSF